MKQSQNTRDTDRNVKLAETLKLLLSMVRALIGCLVQTVAIVIPHLRVSTKTSHIIHESLNGKKREKVAMNWLFGIY